jgi:hypothetical protein
MKPEKPKNPAMTLANRALSGLDELERRLEQAAGKQKPLRELPHIRRIMQAH